MFARKCAASSPFQPLTTAVVFQARKATLILRAPVWMFTSRHTGGSLNSFPSFNKNIHRRWKKTFLYLNRPSMQTAEEFETRL